MSSNDNDNKTSRKRGRSRSNSVDITRNSINLQMAESPLDSLAALAAMATTAVVDDNVVNKRHKLNDKTHEEEEEEEKMDLDLITKMTTTTRTATTVEAVSENQEEEAEKEVCDDNVASEAELQKDDEKVQQQKEEEEEVQSNIIEYDNNTVQINQENESGQTKKTEETDKEKTKEQTITDTKTTNDKEEEKNNQKTSEKNTGKDEINLILLSTKRKGVYECDVCHRDVSQVPRICFSDVDNVDLCLECFANSTVTNNRGSSSAKGTSSSGRGSKKGDTKRKSTSADSALSSSSSDVVAKKQDSQQTQEQMMKEWRRPYRVSDSTRFPLFPSCAKQGEKDYMAIINDSKKEESSSKTKKKKDDKKATSGSADDATNTETSSSQQSQTQNYTGGRNVWTVEEDLRLLDAIAKFGLGNWADISEELSGSNPGASGGDGSSSHHIPHHNSSSNKSAKRCMERYFDDFLGRFGHIVPPYLLIEAPTVNNDQDEKNKRKQENSTVSAIPNAKTGDESTSSDIPAKSTDTSSSIAPATDPTPTAKATTTGSTRKKSRKSDSQSVASLFAPKKKKYIQIETSSTVPDYDSIWPNPYIPDIGVTLGQDVGRDVAVKAEKQFVNAMSSIPQNDKSKERADELKQKWIEKILPLFPQHKKPVLPPRLQDIQNLPGSELSGYMPRRGDFDTEYENEAEHILADMEFSPNDHPSERELKLQIIDIYNAKLDEREKRKEFLRERNLLDYRKNQVRENQLPPDERNLVQRMRLFARFHSPSQHENFLQSLLKAKKLRKEIAQLQYYRSLGLTSLLDAERYELDKARREHHKSAVLQKGGRRNNVVREDNALRDKKIAMLKKIRQQQTQQSTVEKTVDDKTTANSSSNNSESVVKSNTDNSTSTQKGDNVAVVEDEKTSNSSSGEQPPPPASSDENNNNNNNAVATIATDEEEEPQKQQQEVQQKVSFDISKSPGYTYLSKKEIALCQKLELLPKYYLEAKTELIRLSLKAGLLQQTQEDENESSSSNNKSKKKKNLQEQQRNNLISSSSLVMLDIEKDQRTGVIDFVLRNGWISSRMNFKKAGASSSQTMLQQQKSK